MDAFTRNIQLDFRSNEPLYLQIAQRIEQMVARGELRVGDQLPTVRELATELRINFNTVARAYRILDEARLISTQRGRGTYIWEAPSEETMKVLQKKTLDELARRYLADCQRIGFSGAQALESVITLLQSDEPLPDADQTGEPQLS